MTTTTTLVRLLNGQVTDQYDASRHDNPLALAEELAHDECAVKLGVYEPGDGHRAKTRQVVCQAENGFWYKLGADVIEYQVRTTDGGKP